MTGESAMCRGKKAFFTYYQATRAAKNLNRHHDTAKANIYRCVVCHHYHVGNTMKGKADNGKREQTTKHYRQDPEESWLLRDGHSASGWHPDWDS
jgi:hypothetical protein